jgi:hypothetical protein
MNKYITKLEYDALKADPEKMSRFLTEHNLAYPCVRLTIEQRLQELDELLMWSKQHHQTSEINTTL